ncbi:unnamed protein product [Miscanthus lutarioriparius]|uniref:Uncharacterized protein n=1 Tax=Miscanthus lutarioriparius TaxID=422564 RepID=A0A811NU88_9POAL|nr:unnamed protein product [Miscanthus lutarioriparius]
MAAMGSRCQLRRLELGVACRCPLRRVVGSCTGEVQGSTTTFAVASARSQQGAARERGRGTVGSTGGHPATRRRSSASTIHRGIRRLREQPRRHGHGSLPINQPNEKGCGAEAGNKQTRTQSCP